MEIYFEDEQVSVLQQLYDTLNAFPLDAYLPTSLIPYYLMQKMTKYDPIQLYTPAKPCALVFPPLSLPDLTPRTLPNPFPTLPTSSPITIPPYKPVELYGEMNISRLMKVLGDQTMRLYHAILSKQRVLFVGYNHSTQDIASFVFSALGLVSSVVSEVLHRVFPYATLSDLDFLQVFLPYYCTATECN